MYTRTRADGKRETISDFPYPIGKRKCFHKHGNRDETLKAANAFAAYIQSRRPSSTVEVVDSTEKHSIHVVEIET